MKHALRLILFIAALGGLSAAPLKYDRELLSEVENFKEFASTKEILPELDGRIDSVQVVFGTPSFDKRLIGICYYSMNMVVIDKDQYLKLNKKQKQQVIDHELGHCVLGRVHSYDASSAGVVSIMYPDSSARAIFQYEVMRNELFDIRHQGKMGVYQSILFKFTGQTIYADNVTDQFMHANSLNKLKQINETGRFY